MVDPILLSSDVARITFFEDRAEVERVVSLTLSGGVETLLMGGLSLLVDDESLVASVELVDGAPEIEVRVLTTKMTRRTRSEVATPAVELAALDAARDEASARRVEIEQTFARALSSRARLDAALSSWVDAARVAPRGDGATGALREAFDQISSALISSASDRAALESERRDAEERAAAANARFEIASRRISRHEGIAEIQVTAAAACSVTLKIVYRVACALWRPEHWVQLVDNPAKPGAKMLVIRTIATAWQCTGEDWREVACRFSTARPSQSASVPTLSDDVLYLTRRADPGTIHVQAREQVIATTGESNGRVVDVMPGVDDGGEPLWIEAKSAASFPSDGRPVRVDIDRVELACEVDRVAFPERSTSVHVRARGTLTRTTPLLAGPTRVMRGTEVVGRAELSLVGAGEPFVIGCGVDDALRARRTIEEQKETTPVLGTQKSTRTIKVFLSNLSAERRDLTVTERIPVSEIEGVTITLLTREGLRRDEKDGFLHFDVSLAGNATKVLTYSYRVEASSKVVM